MSNILVTTLGRTWQIVPELVGFTNPGLVDLYAHHPECGRIRAVREGAGIKPIDEIWMITTKGEQTNSTVGMLLSWLRRVSEGGACPLLRVWQVTGSGDLVSEAECRHMAEAIMRVVLQADERRGNGQLIISLVGGRKTMSSDIQNATIFFGCHALLHVIQNEAYSDFRLRPEDRWDAKVEAFLGPIPKERKDVVTPLLVGRYERNAAADMSDWDGGAVTGRFFPVGVPESAVPMEVSIPSLDLIAEIEKRSRRASFLYCNHANRLMGKEVASNFLALYNLRPSIVDALKKRRIGVDPAKESEELKWLRSLPKAELHCHLGGIADVSELIEIAAANRGEIRRYEAVLKPLLQDWEKKIVGREAFKRLRDMGPGVPKPLCVAAYILQFEGRPELLEEGIFGDYQEDAGFCGIQFDQYEMLGDLQGSALLQSEASLRAACRILLRKAVEQNVRYLEVRCSPIKYQAGGLRGDDVVRIIDEELSAQSGLLDYGLIFTASRHGHMNQIKEHIDLAEKLLGAEGAGFDRLRGFDLAGNEDAASPADMRELFMPMMRRCMHLTIHAGETSSAESIWEAVYHLSAERIGHGLTLIQNPLLLEKFRDRGIAIEMCPSSNFQIVGFQDNYFPETRSRDLYPLKDYLDKGLRVTVNTDNPGISRTDFSRELHRAARLTRDGLSLWEILLLVRNSFKAVFARRQKAQAMLRSAESEILRLLEEGFPA